MVFRCGHGMRMHSHSANENGNHQLAIIPSGVLFVASTR